MYTRVCVYICSHAQTFELENVVVEPVISFLVDLILNLRKLLPGCMYAGLWTCTTAWLYICGVVGLCPLFLTWNSVMQLCNMYWQCEMMHVSYLSLRHSLTCLFLSANVYLVLRPVHRNYTNSGQCTNSGSRLYMYYWRGVLMHQHSLYIIQEVDGWLLPWWPSGKGVLLESGSSGFDSHFHCGDFSRSNHTRDWNVGTPMVYLPYRVGAVSGSSDDSILWLGEIASFDLQLPY